MGRVFATRTFNRWLRKADLSHEALIAAVQEMERGLIDADLGGHVLKKRVAVAGRGKRGGARVLVATRFGAHWFFLYGFEKNERANIGARELAALQAVAEDLLGLSDPQLNEALHCGTLLEIDHAKHTQKPNP